MGRCVDEGPTGDFSGFGSGEQAQFRREEFDSWGEGMDVSGITGTARRDEEVAGECVLKGGRAEAGGRELEHVEIRFTGFVAAEVGTALAAITRRERLSDALVVDLELDDGRRLQGCEIAGYWGGALAERWFGIGIDLDALAAAESG
jgi:hypothetical protein